MVMEGVRGVWNGEPIALQQSTSQVDGDHFLEVEEVDWIGLERYTVVEVFVFQAVDTPVLWEMDCSLVLCIRDWTMWMAFGTVDPVGLAGNYCELVDVELEVSRSQAVCVSVRTKS